MKKKKDWKILQLIKDEKRKISPGRFIAVFTVLFLITPICYASVFMAPNATRNSLVTAIVGLLAGMVGVALGASQYSKQKIAVAKENAKVKGP